MESYSVYLSEPAEADLCDIYRDITSQLDTPISALTMVALLEETISSLSELPKRNPLVSDERLNQMGYRKLVIINIIIFFSIEEDNKTVNVERVLHRRRDWQRFL